LSVEFQEGFSEIVLFTFFQFVGFELISNMTINAPMTCKTDLLCQFWTALLAKRENLSGLSDFRGFFLN